jgi:hypothetical protein
MLSCLAILHKVIGVGWTQGRLGFLGRAGSPRASVMHRADLCIELIDQGLELCVGELAGEEFSNLGVEPLLL